MDSFLRRSFPAKTTVQTCENESLLVILKLLGGKLQRQAVLIRFLHPLGLLDDLPKELQVWLNRGNSRIDISEMEVLWIQINLMQTPVFGLASPYEQ